MWLLVLPLGFCWNSLNHTIPLPSLSPSYLCQENLPVCKSYHDFRANGHITPSPPVTLVLCPRPGRGFLRPGCPGCQPLDPPPSCRWPGLALAVGPSAQLCVPSGAGEEGRSQEECGICLALSLISPLPGPPGEGQMKPQLPEPTSPAGEGKRGADARSLLPQTAFLDLLPSCPALLVCS